MQQQRRRNPLKVLQRIEEQRRTTNHLQALMNSLYLTHNGIGWIKKIHYFVDQKLECGIFSNYGGISQLHNEKVFKQNKNEEKILFQQLASIAIITYLQYHTYKNFYHLDQKKFPEVCYSLQCGILCLYCGGGITVAVEVWSWKLFQIKDPLVFGAPIHCSVNQNIVLRRVMKKARRRAQ